MAFYCCLWLLVAVCGCLYVDVYLPKTQGLSPLEASDVSRMYFKMSQCPGAREPRSTLSTRSLKIPRKWWCLDDVGRDIWVWDVT